MFLHRVPARGRRRPAVLHTLLLALLASCGGGDSPTGPQAVASVTIAPPAGPIGALGETLTLTAIAADGRGRPVTGVPVSWSSSDASVATVTAGVVTAVANGTAVITATAGAASGAVPVVVQQRVATVAVSATRDTIYALGDTVRVSATARDARGAPMGSTTASWTTLQPAVATVDGNGLVTAVSSGTATIRATAGTLTADRTIVVQQRAARLQLVRQPDGARAGDPLSTQPWLEVQDARGVVIATDNSTVVTAAIEGIAGGVVSGGSATASGGFVRFTTLTLGATAGTRTLVFSAPGVAPTLAAPVLLTAGSASVLVAVSGNGQQAPAGTVLPQPLRAAARDAWGNPVAGASVEYSVLSGGGSLAAPSATTGADGTTAVAFALSRYAGPAVVRASVGAASAQFSALATPNGTIRGTVNVNGLPLPGAGGARASASGSASGSASASGRATGSAAGFGGAAKLASDRVQRLPAPAPRRADRTPSLASAVAGDARAEAFARASGRAPAVPGELLVTYTSQAVGAPALGSAEFRQQATMQALAGDLRAALAEPVPSSLVQTVSVSPGILTARVRLRPGVDEAQAMAQLRADPRVASVEPNYFATTHEERHTPLVSYLRTAAGVGARTIPAVTGGPGALSATFPTPGFYPTDARYVDQAWHYNLVSLPRAWQVTQGSPSVIVAVVDDGIRFDHPAVAGLLTNDGYDFVSTFQGTLCGSGSPILSTGDGNGYDPDPTVPVRRSTGTGGCVTEVSSSSGHGLHVAATVSASRGNASGLVGTNFTTRIRPVRALGIWGSGTNYDIAQAILYAAGLPADNGQGGFVTPAGGPAHIINLSLGGPSPSEVQRLAVEQANLSGALLVVSAGNANSSVPQYPASYPGVLSVAAVAPTLSRANYSSFGSTVGIAAPGGQTSTGTDHGVRSATWNFVTDQPLTDSWQGTSMAAPHVAGVAALVKARFPAISGQLLRARLQATAIDIGQPGVDPLFGAGLVNARNALSGTSAPARTLYVGLVHAATGMLVQSTVAAPNGQFEFTAVPDGDFWVFAGSDEDGDGIVGLPGRLWGAAGGATTPSTLRIDGAGLYNGTFALLPPNEVEPNDTPAQADLLLPGGHVNGSFASTNDRDVFVLRVAEAGTYRLEITGQVGACGFALEADPILTVSTGQGVTLAINDDINVSARDYCSGITIPLAPGDHLLRAEAYSAGRYTISARRVP